VAVPVEELPVLLPDDVDFSPHGESPLAKKAEFVNGACPSCGGPARRETDTMDTFVDSSWYFLRYTSPHDQERAWAPDAVERWLPVDQYSGGIEHAILHLLYSRFVTKVLYDLGYVKFTEPFINLLNQGMVIYKGAALSKSRGNVVEPLPLIEKWGADSIRLSMMFAAPVEDDVDWATVSVSGVHKWLGRVWRAVHEAVSAPSDVQTPGENGEALRRLTHRTVKAVTGDYERFGFNVAISKMMTLSNELQRALELGVGGEPLRETAEKLVLMLAPMAPHICEELWQEVLGHPENVVTKTKWPTWDEDLTKEQTVTLVIQVDGKVRDRITVEADASEEDCRQAALSSARARAALDGREIADVIVRAPRLVNLVTRPSG
jgi:leucyl-tRNA synthetase